MARTKKTRRYYRSKGRWSSNIKDVTLFNNITADSTFYITTDLCQNPVQNEASVSQQYTVKNVEFSFSFESNIPESIEGLSAYIMFVPQGMIVTETYPNFHPEYIMAYRYLGNPSGDLDIYRNPIKIKTRLARRLQTGDKIVFLIKGGAENVEQIQLISRGLVRWWTKAN